MKEQINLGYIHDGSVVKDNNNVRGGEGKEVRIQRSLGMWSGIAIIVGTIIGSGIWVTPGSIMTYSESVGIFLVQWAVCGVLSALGAMCYIELACVVPLSGGETVYLKEAFGDFVSFIFSWLRAVVLGPTSCAFLAGVSAEYVLRIDPSIRSTIDANWPGGVFYGSECAPEDEEGCGRGFGDAKKIVGIGLMIISSIINILSSRGAAIVQNIVTISKLIGVVIVIIGGFVRLGGGHTESFESGFERLPFLDSIGPASIGLIAFNGLWNYDGWNQLNFVAEEIQDPMRNLPRSILISMPIVVIVYVLMNISYLSAMSAEQLVNSPAVGVLWAEVVLGSWNWIIPLFVFISAFGTLHASLFASGRQVYAAGREGHLPEVVSYVNKYTLTPLPGLLFNGVLGIVFLSLRDIDALLNMYMVAASFFYGLCMLALIVLRFKKKHVERAFKIWIIVPVLIMLFFWYCTIAPLTELDEDGSIVEVNIDMYKWNAICLAPGLFFYIVRFVWRWFWYRKYGISKKPVPGAGIFTKLVQKLLCVYEEEEETAEK